MLYNQFIDWKMSRTWSMIRCQRLATRWRTRSPLTIFSNTLRMSLEKMIDLADSTNDVVENDDGGDSNEGFIEQNSSSRY